MKLEDQVCSLALSRRLKELGVKQSGIFYWKCSNGTLERKSGIKISTELKFGPTPTFQNAGTWTPYTAFTVAELGELLSMVIGGRNKKGIGDGSWWCQSSKANTEADARALALIAEKEEEIKSFSDVHDVQTKPGKAG